MRGSGFEQWRITGNSAEFRNPQLSAIDLGNQILNEMGGFPAFIAKTSAVCSKSKASVWQKRPASSGSGSWRAFGKRAHRSRLSVENSEDIAELVGREMRGLQQEELWVLMLNARNRYLGRNQLYRGSQDATTVRVGEIFKEAVRKNVYAIALVHNHPSGNPKESAEDVNLTRAVIEAGNVLDIRLLDHVIIAGQDHTSIRRNHPELWA